MSSSARHRHRGRHGNAGGCRSEPRPCPRPDAPELAEDSSPVVRMFRQFAMCLDRKHDRYERLVKKSRDVTIESKRIIFMLHRVTRDDQSRVLLDEAAERFSHLEATTLREIALELVGQDPYIFIRAISPGLQEYIEALSFYYYLLQDRMISWAEAQARLTYCGQRARPAADSGAAEAQTGAGEAKPVSATPTRVDEVAPVPQTPAVAEEDAPVQQTVLDDPAPPAAAEAELQLLLPYHEYVLGIADLTGELMRKCISSVSSGELEQCWRLCSFLRTIHEGFINIGNTGPREITRKMYTLRQSVAKVENACYQLKVRGEEIPRHMLADVFSAADDYQPHDDYAGD